MLAALAGVKLAGVPVSAVVATEEKEVTLPVPPVNTTFNAVVLVATVMVKVLETFVPFRSDNSITNV